MNSTDQPISSFLPNTLFATGTAELKKNASTSPSASSGGSIYRTRYLLELNGIWLADHTHTEGFTTDPDRALAFVTVEAAAMRAAELRDAIPGLVVTAVQLPFPSAHSRLPNDDHGQ